MLDPIATGMRLLVEDVDATGVLDVELAPGAFGGAGTRGWVTKGTGWRYVDHTATPLAGVKTATIKPSAADLLRLRVKALRASYDLVPGKQPVSVVATFGGQAAAAAGSCGEIDFTASECASGAFLSCRR